MRLSTENRRQTLSALEAPILRAGLRCINIRLGGCRLTRPRVCRAADIARIPLISALTRHSARQYLRDGNAKPGAGALFAGL